MESAVGEASSTPPPRSCTHGVFFNFRGEDTRNTIKGHLNAALERKGIKTYTDDKKLEAGKVISSELLKAIEESMFAIIVFSPNYASSSWCLDELQHIVKCRKKLGLSIVTVFYGVEPSDVRYQKGSFEKAFQKHEERFGQNSDKVKTWRDALVQVANVSGFDFKNKDEATLVESIADHIYSKIPKLPYSTENLVGIASRMEEVMRHIGTGSNDVRFIGIWGMGGIGKTTIAKEVYEAIQEKFEVSYFLTNVREVRMSNKIVDKQKKLLAKANISVVASDDEHDIQKEMQKSLRTKKVLLVLDDVSDKIELEKLAGKKDWFGPGSRIIITTRDSRLLEICEAHETREVRGLDDSDSFDFFCLQAFKKEKPDEKYLDLIKEVVKYCGGLPLALKVLGSQLLGKSIDVWRDAIDKIKSIPDDKIHDKLKISYDSLDVTQKNIFLDISCFFKGWEKDEVIKILESCGYKGVRIGIDILIERSLVKINEEYNIVDEKYNVFEMHDLLQEMGRSIVIQNPPISPGQRSRIWSDKDIDVVLANNKGSEAIQGIVLPMSGVLELPWRSAEVLSNMTQLKLLIMSNIADDLSDFSGLPASKKVSCRLDYPLKTLPLPDQQYGLSSLPTSLKVIDWWGYPLKTLPLSDQHYELVEIRLRYSYIENLWHGKKFLGELEHLDLSGSCQLKQTPDLSELPNLRTLRLVHCESLTEVHPYVAQHKGLTILDLTGCTDLKALPGKLEMSSLKELILDECSSLENLPEFGECMESLSRLSLANTHIKKLPTSVRCLVGLQDLNLYDCKNIECLPDITYMVGLQDLNLYGCKNIECLPNITDGKRLLTTLSLSCCHLTEESFPPDFGRFSSLTHLDLSCNDFVRIPINIHDIPKLKRLKLNCCDKLRCLPKLPSSIRKLEAWRCWSLNISESKILSTVCGAFESRSQDRGQVLLEMSIPGMEIPPWFVHQQDGNSVSIPPCDYPPNERLGIALCFLPRCDRTFLSSSGNTCIESALVTDNGNTFNTIRITPGRYGGNHLYIICLSNDYFSDRFHQGTCFELRGYHDPAKVLSMTFAARYVSEEDMKLI